jgi:hypothetical protein
MLAHGLICFCKINGRSRRRVVLSHARDCRRFCLSGIQVSRLNTAKVRAIARINSLFGLAEHGILHWLDIAVLVSIFRSGLCL